jgi:hypothetical protein
MGSSDHKFCLDNFKRWMKEQNRDHMMDRPETPSLVGTYVESKVGVKKLVAKMVTEGNNLEELAIEFRESGGRIAEVDGKNFLIEVGAGAFYLNRFYVRRG